jgi:hypothetical protein
VTAVSRELRHTRRNRCPICGGAEGDPRGQEKRCSGYTSTDGKYEHCSREEFAGAIDANGAGLFAHRMNGSCRCGTSHGPDLQPSFVDTTEATYDYRDETGALVMQVVRKTGKRFLQRKPDGAGGWIWKIGDVRRVPYRLPELIAAVGSGETIYVVEGEKDVDSMATAGFTATCNPGGAEKWHFVAKVAREVLAGADVVVIADADKPGRLHARQVAASLERVARTVTTREPPAPWKDASAMLEGGLTLAELVPLDVEELPANDAMPDDERFDGPDEDIADDIGAATTGAITTIGVPELFAPLPPIEWTVEGLGLTAGAASVLAGFGFVGKTVVAQTIALAIASGTPLWGLFSVTKGRVLHLDYEQGRRLTSERYQRLAKGAGITAEQLGDNLRAAIMPSVYLDAATAGDAYARAFEGFRFAIIDSLRAAAPSADENSSDVRRHIDVLTRASELTGCMPLFLHHARKPSEDSKGGAKMSLRGSSAIFDACATVFVLEADKGKPTRVRHEKDRVRGILMPDFGLQVEDVEIDGDARAGLRVVHLEGEQLEARGATSTSDDKKKAAHQETIRVLFRTSGPIFDGGVRALRDALGINRDDFGRAFEPMRHAGEITLGGTYHHPSLTWRGEH